MSEKQFIVETVEITDCDTDVSRIAKVITDTKETYSYEDLYEVAELLNEQQATIQELERKLNKYAKIGEEQLKQIIELQEENRELRQSVEYWQKKYEEGTETFQIN